MRKLRSWKVQIGRPCRSYTHKSKAYYVVARSQASAIYQAKEMANYTPLEVGSRAGVRSCRALEDLE